METLTGAANRGSISTGFNIENSCSFHNFYNYTGSDTGDDYLFQTQTNHMGDVSSYDSDNGKRWIWSGWVKRGSSIWVGNPYQNKAAIGHQSDAQRNRQSIFGGKDTARYSWFGFDSLIGNEDALMIDLKEGATARNFTTNAQYRDTSAWYHFVLKVDSTQSTSTDRFQLWTNGVRVTSWDTYATITQNSTGIQFVEDNMQHYFCRHYYNESDVPFHGYLAEIHFIHGADTADYTATTFGEFNDDGIWVPIDPDVTYGYRSWHLDFQDASDLGKDVSGKGNHFTSYSMSAINQTTDTPTNNWCVMQNPQNHANGGHPVYKMGGLHMTAGGSSTTVGHGTMGVTSGKWYYESYMEDDFNTPQNHGHGWIGSRQSIGDATGHGWTRLSTRVHYGEDVGRVINGWASSGAGSGRHANSGFPGDEDQYSGNAAEDQVMGCAVDLDAGKMWWHIGGTWFSPTSGNVGNPATGANPQFTNVATVLDSEYLLPAANHYTSGPPIRILNFGNPPTTIFTAIGTYADDNGYGSFAYDPPSGFLALCSKNIGSTGGGNTIDDPSKYFQSTLWTGTAQAMSITNLGNSDLQPDMVWWKRRDSSGEHRIMDSTRGVTKYIATDSAAAEDTYSGYITGFNSDGFSIAVGDTSSNYATSAYVGWQWKMNGGTTSSNTSGSITSTVQANTTARQSIITYTGTGTAATIGHSLGVKPHMIIIKNRNNSGSTNWVVFHHRLTSNAYNLILNSTAAQSNSVGYWNSTSPTSSVFSIKGGSDDVNNSAGNNYIAYAFAGVEGYSKFDMFEGNDPSNYETDGEGTFVYCGFKPAFVMYKPVDIAANWIMFDHKRNKGGGAAAAEGGAGNENHNIMWERVYPNTNGIQVSDESTGSPTWIQDKGFIDFKANGFQIKLSDGTLCDTWNDEDDTYIFAAFAETPFVTSKGVPTTAR